MHLRLRTGCLSQAYYSILPYKLTCDVFKARDRDFDAVLISLDSNGPVCLQPHELHWERQMMSEGRALCQTWSLNEGETPTPRMHGNTEESHRVAVKVAQQREGSDWEACTDA